MIQSHQNMYEVNNNYLPLMRKLTVRHATQPDKMNQSLITRRQCDSLVMSKRYTHIRRYYRGAPREEGYTMPRLRQPYFVPRESEQLTNQILVLKVSNNDLLSDQKQLKSVNCNLERELNRLKLTQGMDRQNLVQKFRSKYKEVKEQLQTSEKQIQIIKKSFKSTRIQEIEVELELYKTETMRMRIQLEEYERLHRQFLTQNEVVDDPNSIKIGVEVFKNLVEDNQHMYSQIQDLHIALNKQKLQLAAAHRARMSANSYAAQGNRCIQERDSEIALLRRRVDDLDARILKLNEKPTKLEIRKLVEKDHELVIPRILSQQIQVEQLQHIEHHHQQNHHHQQHQQQYVVQEPTLLLSEQRGSEVTLKIQRELQERVSQYDHQLHQQNDVEEAGQRSEADDHLTLQTIDENAIEVPTKASIHHSEVRRNSSIHNHIQSRLMFDEIVERSSRQIDVGQGRRLRKVGFADVVNLGSLLRYRLMDQGVSMEAMTECLIPPNHDGLLSLMQMEWLVQQKPFSLNSHQSNLLARYLTEDNDEEYVYYNPQREQEVDIVKSVARKVIGRYEVFSAEEHARVRQQTIDIVGKFRQSIIENVCMLMGKKVHAERCTRSDFHSALKFCDLQLPPRCLEYLHLMGYQSNPEDINIVAYRQILDF